MKAVFFYGLFMDQQQLIEKGFHPTQPVIAYLDDFELKIGQRATLVKSDGKRAYGAVMSLNDDELEHLYSAPTVKDYRPETVTVNEMDGGSRQVQVYNLPESSLLGKNIEYAKALQTVAKKLGLPWSYIDEINTWTN